MNTATERRLLYVALSLGFGLMLAAGGTAHADHDPTYEDGNIPNEERERTGSGAARDVLIRADLALNHLEYTYYRYGGDYWDEWDGVYKVDCSGYINRLLDDAVPTAYDRLRDARDTSRPSTADYYRFLRRIDYYDVERGWRRLKKVEDLRPGDLLVWRYQDDDGDTYGGHSMIVASRPVEYDHRRYKIRVTDAARSGHSRDNRGGDGSGVGVGWIKLKRDSEGRPYAYAWSLGGRWRYNATFSLGRPVVRD